LLDIPEEAVIEPSGALLEMFEPVVHNGRGLPFSFNEAYQPDHENAP
jgi:hypothetical protein